MALLDKLRGSNKVKPVGQSLESGRTDEGRERRQNLYVKSGIFLALVLLTLLVFPWEVGYSYTAEVDDVWRNETLIAPFRFAIYKTDAELAAERRSIRQQTPPYFQQVLNARERMSAHRDTVQQQVRRVLEAYAEAEFNRSRGRTEQASQDSARAVGLRRNARLVASPPQWQLLIDDYLGRQQGLAQSSRNRPRGRPLYEELAQDAWRFGMELLNIGVIDLPADSVQADQVSIRNEADRTEVLRDKVNLFGLNEAYASAEANFQQAFPEEPEVAGLANGFFRSIFVPSLTFLEAETRREWQRLEASISPTGDVIEQGEVIVRKNDLITPEIVQNLYSLERWQADQSTTRRIPWKGLLGHFLLALATYLIFFLYLYLVRRTIFFDNQQILLISILFVLLLGLFGIAIRFPGLNMYMVPVATVAVLITVMFDSRVGLFATLTMAFIGGHLLDYDFEFAFATFFACALGVYSVRDIKNRGQFFISAGLVFVGYIAVLGASWLLNDVPDTRLWQEMIFVGINSFMLILAYPLLWVFERLFDITTDLTLLELSDTNRPLLKDLSLRAPGTFNHTLQVANLAEAAADSVGANALLTRVGALYHDIGKMLKPEYFVENQRSEGNPHEHLKPRMSALIIVSHVKEGLEIARKYNLPKRVSDFIPYHHGTTRIEYFYRKALDQHSEEDPPILESEFRYPGPRPQSKEAGILMLADAVEAASKSLRNPTHKRLDSLINAIFKARIEDGQLDDTDLTFRELSQIKETFLAMCLGMYHVRVKYPGQKKEPEEERSTIQGESERKDGQHLGTVPEIAASTSEINATSEGEPIEVKSLPLGKRGEEAAAQPVSEEEAAEPAAALVPETDIEQPPGGVEAPPAANGRADAEGPGEEPTPLDAKAGEEPPSTHQPASERHAGEQPS